MLTFDFLCLMKENRIEWHVCLGVFFPLMSFPSVWSCVAPSAKHITNTARFSALIAKGAMHAIDECNLSISEALTKERFRLSKKKKKKMVGHIKMVLSIIYRI